MAQWIPWLPHYKVNVEDIDHQHEELFRMMNELFEATWDGKGKDFICDCLKFLANYCVDHFKTEENYMKQFGYPDYDAHKKAHDEFTSKTVEFINVYENSGVTTEMLVSVVSEIGKWTKDHIRDMDQDLGKFLSQGTGASPDTFAMKRAAV